jgi:hypothetical protein
MSDRLLREAIRGILREEIVSVTRGSEEATFDAQFTPQGDIASAERVDLSAHPGLEEMIKHARKYTSVPQGILMLKLMELQDAGISLQAPFKSPTAAVKLLNTYWRDAIDWPTESRIGRGEVAMNLAFATDPSASEPDFVSSTGVGLSVKYMGPNGAKTAKTGEASTQVPKLIRDLQKILGGVEFPQATWGEADLAAALQAISPRKRATAIQQVKTKLDEMKVAIVTEHDAAGIMMLDSQNGYYFVGPSTATRDIKIVYIRNSGTRIEFGGPKRSDSNTQLDNALSAAG